MKNVLKLAATLLLAFAFTSCDKGDDTPSPNTPTSNKREVKYEITGTFTNRLLLAYTIADGTTVSETVSLPWTKNITYNTTVSGLGLGGNTAVGASSYVPGETVNIKIYSGGTVVKNINLVSDAKGLVSFSTAYVF
jgi:hypothetical protein